MGQTEIELHEVVGYYLLQPIAILLEALEQARPDVEHFFPVVVLESSYAAAVIVLTLTATESFVNWTEFILKGKASGETPAPIIRRLFPSSDFYTKLEEIYRVRNAIVHSHLWKRQATVQINQFEENPVPSISYGVFEPHPKHANKANFDTSTAKTKLLGINIIPTRITRHDAVLILKVVSECLMFLENECNKSKGDDTAGVNFSNQRVVFKGQTMLFLDLVNSL